MADRKAVTLAELVVVLFILAALGSLMVPLCSDNMATAADNVTRASLTQIRDAMLQYWQDTHEVVLDGVATTATEAERFDIAWLFSNPVTGDQTVAFDPNTRSGWNGPYLTGSNADVAQWGPAVLLDGWNQAIEVQYVTPGSSLKDVRIVSAGRNGVIDLPAATATASLTSADIGDDVYVAITLR